jgi:tripartite-type tricarboxylate transporter receptor subunit TctC
MRILIGVLALGMLQSAWPQAYPTKPIRMVVPFTAGSASDILSEVMK